MPQAAVPAALGFYRPLRRWSFQFVRLWRSSRRRPSSGCPLGACTIEQEQDLARVITGDGLPFIAKHIASEGQLRFSICPFQAATCTCMQRITV